MDMTGMVFGSYMGGLMRPIEGLISRLLMASENNHRNMRQDTGGARCVGRERDGPSDHGGVCQE